jgi:uncharacterized membrane protein
MTAAPGPSTASPPVEGPIEGPVEPLPRPCRFGGIVAAVVVVGLLAGAVTVVRGSIVAPRPETGMAGMPGMAAGRDAPPVALESLRTDVAALYRHADEHAELYRDVPCYCGCDRFADHRHLYDCFVRPDGAGFDAHGAGCAICQAEALEVRRLLRSGRSPTEIRKTIIDTFGPATNPARA